MTAADWKNKYMEIYCRIYFDINLDEKRKYYAGRYL